MSGGDRQTGNLLHLDRKNKKKNTRRLNCSMRKRETIGLHEVCISRKEERKKDPRVLCGGGPKHCIDREKRKERAAL